MQALKENMHFRLADVREVATNDGKFYISPGVTKPYIEVTEETYAVCLLKINKDDLIELDRMSRV